MARDIGKKLEAFVKPLLIELDEQIYKRLVRTFLATLQAIVQFRERAHGLLLSEQGAYITSPESAPVGTKRLSNLLRSKKWSYLSSDRAIFVASSGPANKPIQTAKDAWQVVFAYVRRWQVETAIRFGKSELAMESLCPWQWDNRVKLLLIVTLVYAFLLSFLATHCDAIREGYCGIGATGRESGAEKSQFRSTVCVLPRVVYGSLILRPPFRKSGMTHV